MDIASTFFTDCSESSLGGLSVSDALPDIKKIKGVDIPLNVLRELQRLGHPIESYNRAELQEAVRACAMDANLIDDPHGHHFSDKLVLTPEEKKKRAPEEKNFCSELKHEREHARTCEHEEEFSHV